MSREGSVYSRGEGRDRRWYYKTDIAPRGARKRKQVNRGGFRTKADARAALNEVLNEVGQGNYVQPQRLTFGDYLTSWHETCATRGLALTTTESYGRYIQYHVLRYDLADLQLQDVKAEDLDRLYRHLLEKGQVRSEKPLSNRSVRYLHNIFTKALGDALKRGLVARNEAKIANPPAARMAKAPEAKIWQEEELRRFLSLVESDPFYCLWRLAAMTGMRRGELTGLRWCDVDFDQGRVIVRGAVVKTKGQGITRVPRPKTRHGERHVALDPRTCEILRMYQQQTHGVGEEPVFHTGTGQWLNPGVVSTKFDRICAASGLPRIRLHDLRHTHASILLQSGVNPKVVQERLGHASASFTMDRYVHSLRYADHDAIDSFVARIEG